MTDNDDSYIKIDTVANQLRITVPIEKKISDTVTLTEDVTFYLTPKEAFKFGGRLTLKASEIVASIARE